MDPKVSKHYVLGFERGRSGAFEHAFGLAQNLHKRNYNVKYYANWWGASAFDVDLHIERLTSLDTGLLNSLEGIFYLQTHTWEYNGFLDLIKGRDSKIIYGLHAIIPYYHMGEKDKISFLKGELSASKFKEIIENKLSKREKAQLSAIGKSDHILTISENHKKVLEILGVEKPIHVFENVSDFFDLSEETLGKSMESALNFRKELGIENIILYCGRVYEQKGSFGLFESFRMIRDKYHSSKLVLLGSEEGVKEKLLLNGLNKEDLPYMTFIPWINKQKGEVNEFLKYFLASDVLIQPMITTELYSKSVIDAMTFGIPTITCESPYTIGSSENADAICNSFVQIKENPKEVQKIVRKAKKKIKLENTWDSYISRLEKIILEK